MKFNTKVIHGNQSHEKVTGSVNVPVFLLLPLHKNLQENIQVTNILERQNPTRQVLEDALASIENGARGLAFGSGLAAIDWCFEIIKSRRRNHRS